MSKKDGSAFLDTLQYFLNIYLIDSKGLSKNTVRSYRTTFMLLVKFMSEEKSIPADKICYSNLNIETLSEFMAWLEKKRGCSVNTRNQRLAALSSFSEYAQNTNFDAASVFRAAILRIPIKKTEKKRRIGFTVEELKILLALPGTDNEIALRDTVLLSFMYSTGGRAQEICNVKVKDLRLNSDNPTVDLLGKGSKARRVRIPVQCAEMLKKYIRHRKIDTLYERHVFSSQTHEQMTVSCIEGIFNKYITVAKMQYPELFKEERYSPHCMRHTTGQHMLEAGVPLMVIKSFLGHASVQTTQIYAESSQSSVDKHVREWNEHNFAHFIRAETEKHNETEIPDFLLNRM